MSQRLKRRFLHWIWALTGLGDLYSTSPKCNFIRPKGKHKKTQWQKLIEIVGTNCHGLFSTQKSQSYSSRTYTLYSVIKEWASHCLVPGKIEGHRFELGIGSRTNSSKKRLVNHCRRERRYSFIEQILTKHLLCAGIIKSMPKKTGTQQLLQLAHI